MRCGSLFSGTTAWHSDVEPGPRAILAHHWPDVPNIGDITAVEWALATRLWLAWACEQAAS